MRKLSWRHLTNKRLSRRAKIDADKLIREMRRKVKQDPEVIEKFKKYDVPLDEIDDIHVEFCVLDVSAKTKDKKIYFNEKFLEKKDPLGFSTPYFVHECIHFLQQKTGNSEKMKQKNEDYLDLDTEREAFSAQIDYKEREEGKDEAERYVEQLLDHHDINGKEREDKKDELLGE